jgi:hypothetical protein
MRLSRFGGQTRNEVLFITLTSVERSCDEGNSADENAPCQINDDPDHVDLDRARGIRHLPPRKKREK